MNSAKFDIDETTPAEQHPNCQLVKREDHVIKCMVNGKKAYAELLSLTVCLGISHVVRLLDTDVTPSHTFLKFERFNGTLYRYVVDEPDLVKRHHVVVLRSLASALCAMHALDLVHGDIKADNVLMTADENGVRVVLGDLGHTHNFKLDPRTSVHALRNRAPELFVTRPRPYWGAVDIWALGCLYFYMMTGRYLFRDDEEQDIKHRTAAMCKAHERFFVDPIPKSKLLGRMIGPALETKLVDAWLEMMEDDAILRILASELCWRLQRSLT